MNTFDLLFLHFFQYYKNRKNKNASSIATLYVTVLQCSLLLLLGMFFAGFFNQMHVDTMPAENAWTLFVLTSIFVAFKNWMQYAGKKRNLLNAKMLKKKKLNYNLWLLWLLPVIVLGLVVILSKAI